MCLRRQLLFRSACCIFLGTLIFFGGNSILQASPKIPLVKKKRAPSGQQTFVGKIKSIDTKERVLILTTTEGDQEESFEYKKSVRVTSAHKAGELKVSDLTVGMLVTVYFKSTKSTSEVYEIFIM